MSRSRAAGYTADNVASPYRYVVRMPDVVPVIEATYRAGSDQDVGPVSSDLPGNVLSQLKGWGKHRIFIVQEDYVPHA